MAEERINVEVKNSRGVSPGEVTIARNDWGLYEDYMMNRWISGSFWSDFSAAGRSDYTIAMKPYKCVPDCGC